MTEENKELIYSQKEVIKFIDEQLGYMTGTRWQIIKAILDKESEYKRRMKTVESRGENITNCEYCRDGSKAILEDRDKTVASFIHIADDQIETEVHDKETGKSYVSGVKINFCPMCGARL